MADEKKDALLEGIKSVGDKVDKIKTDITNDVDAKVKSVDEKLELIKAANEGHVTREQFEKELNRLEQVAQKQKVVEKSKTLDSVLEQAFREKEADFASYADNSRGGKFSLELKDTYTRNFPHIGTAVNPSISSYNAGFAIYHDQPHMRNYIPTGQCNAGLIYYAVKRPKTGPGPGYQTAEGELKPRFDLTWETRTAPVVTIAGILKVSRQALHDVKALRSYISVNGREELLKFEDREIIYGSGAGGSLEGIHPNAQVLGPNSGNLYDKLLGAFKELANQGSSPEVATHAFVNAGDYYDALMEKGSDGHYLFPQVMWNGEGIRVAGVPVIPITQLVAGDYITGDFHCGVQLFFHEDINIRFFEQNVDDVERNMITVRIEERVALPLYKPYAFAKNDNQ